MKMYKLLREYEYYNDMPHRQQRNADTNVKRGRKMKKIKSVQPFVLCMTFKKKYVIIKALNQTLSINMPTG
ncbi:hypothetical protein AGMMS49921_13160 [Endomicrobiia bacterium]|nr:hypothetical protein AGMMS49921_13160 [Endomicrobiia bacterium]